MCERSAKYLSIFGSLSFQDSDAYDRRQGTFVNHFKRLLGHNAFINLMSCRQDDENDAAESYSVVSFSLFPSMWVHTSMR